MAADVPAAVPAELPTALLVPGAAGPDVFPDDGVLIGETVSDAAGPIVGGVSEDVDDDDVDDAGDARTASEGGCDGGSVSDGAGSGDGVVEQPTTNAASATMYARERTGGLDMEWILLEAAIALGIGVFIAWWLMRGKDRSPRDR